MGKSPRPTQPNRYRLQNTDIPTDHMFFGIDEEVNKSVATYNAHGGDFLTFGGSALAVSGATPRRAHRPNSVFVAMWDIMNASAERRQTDPGGSD